MDRDVESSWSKKMAFWRKIYIWEYKMFSQRWVKSLWWTSLNLVTSTQVYFIFVWQWLLRESIHFAARWKPNFLPIPLSSSSCVLWPRAICQRKCTGNGMKQILFRPESTVASRVMRAAHVGATPLSQPSYLPGANWCNKNCDALGKQRNFFDNSVNYCGQEAMCWQHIANWIYIALLSLIGF